MDGASATSNGASEKHPQRTEEGQKGWLSKKAHFTRRWRPAWFHIRDSQLFYGGNRQTPVKSISLIGAEIETLEDDVHFSWMIKPKNSKRTFFLRASSSEEQQQWLVALCEAQMSSGRHSSNACVLQ